MPETCRGSFITCHDACNPSIVGPYHICNIPNSPWLFFLLKAHGQGVLVDS
jgi:hypothetical protein